MKKVLYIGAEEMKQESAKKILDEFDEYDLKIYRLETQNIELLNNLVEECEIIAYTIDSEEILKNYVLKDKILIKLE